MAAPSPQAHLEHTVAKRVPALRVLDGQLTAKSLKDRKARSGKVLRHRDARKTKMSSWVPN